MGAAERRYMTTERIIDTDQFAAEGPLQTMCISRLLTDGVIETPGGAHFTACVPDYGRDEEFQRAYVSAAADPEAWATFRQRFLEVDEAGYQAADKGASSERAGQQTDDAKERGTAK
ncbi:MAG TPA: hypothetical protein VGY51_02900, partial [Acidimicrobiales bacterium]|nr:hypothetical protein [Acidimicrobiales bacterium]